MSLALVETANHLMIQQTERHMGKRKHKPSDPAEIARQRAAARHDPSQWGKNESALSLEANADVWVEPGDRKRVERITRYDAFALLEARAPKEDKAIMSAALVAVRRLEETIATLHRTAGQREGKVDGSNGVEAFSAARIEAGKALDAIKGLLNKRDRDVLTSLCEATVIEGRGNWHVTVFRATGLIRDHERGEAVKTAMLALLGAYQAIDNEPRRAAA